MYTACKFPAWFAFFCLCCFIAEAQTPGVGSVTITGSVLGPIYPCGDISCPTYDSGQIEITVNGFNAIANYSQTIGQKWPTQLTTVLAAQLNTASSPVSAVISKATITITSRLSGTVSNYPVSARVTHSSLFSRPSFAATLSGNSLTGGTGAPVSVGTLIQQTSNNTSLCSSVLDPAGNPSYCTAFFNGLNTNPMNSGAQSLVPNTAAGHVSNSSIKQLIYTGWTGRLICEYQPWFGLSSHISVGYNENSPATVASQGSMMISEGCDINLVDWYGSLSPNQVFNLTTANTIFADLNSRSGYPLKFGIMEDAGALKYYSCPPSGLTESGTVSCLQGALIQDMDYINTHYAYSPVYWTDAGQPVIAYFGSRTDWPILTGADWEAIWSAVKVHTDAYIVPFKFIFQFGSFTNATYDNGRFGWVQPPPFSPTQQFWWGSVNNSSPTYLDALYSAGLNHRAQLTVGALYKGFDDNNASWSGNRVIAQQCGQVLLNTAHEISRYFGGAKPQIPYIQVITWNDFEEGTAVEEGIDNCYTVNASLTGSTLTWTLIPSDMAYASTSTIHHFTVYFADAIGNIYPAASNLPVTTNILDLFAIVPAGTWTVYVEMVGKPLIINRMSNGLTFIH